MKLDPTFLRSKVGRRLFTLFILCSLAPITVLAVLSFTHVTNQLDEQSRNRLHQASKALGMAIFERLSFLEAGMRTAAAHLELGMDIGKGEHPIVEDLAERFDALGLLSGDGEYTQILGDAQQLPTLEPEQAKHVADGKTLLIQSHTTAVLPRFMMIRTVDEEDPSRGVLLGELDTRYLWGAESTLPPLTELCILTNLTTVLFCSGEVPSSKGVGRRLRESAAGDFEWSKDGEAFLAGYWSIPLCAFSAAPWTVILSESIESCPRTDGRFQKDVPSRHSHVVVGRPALEHQSNPTEPRPARESPGRDTKNRGEGF